MATKQHGDLDPKYDNYDYPTVSINNQTGHPGHTNPQENAAVHQLRQLLEQEGCKDRLDTLTLLRFLRARKFDVQLSKQMFLDTEKWRKEFKVDQLMKDFTYPEKEEVFKYYPQYYRKCIGLHTATAAWVMPRWTSPGKLRVLLQARQCHLGEQRNICCGLFLTFTYRQDRQGRPSRVY